MSRMELIVTGRVELLEIYLELVIARSTEQVKIPVPPISSVPLKHKHFLAPLFPLRERQLSRHPVGYEDSRRAVFSQLAKRCMQFRSLNNRNKLTSSPEAEGKAIPPSLLVLRDVESSSFLPVWGFAEYVGTRLS